MQYRKFIIYSLFLALILNSCKSDTSNSQEASDNETKIEAKKYPLSPFTASPSFDDARISSMSYNNNTFKFGVDGESYELGKQTPDAPEKMCANSAQGQHIHLIIDNGPYAAKYVNEFEYMIEDGEHVLLAFLSRSYHESIKSPAAAVAQNITVERGSLKASEEIETPMLFYSRPKGAYTGADTEKIMLDFYLKNTSIGTDGNYVEADINGEIHKITKWQPYYIENLPDGENTITLTLKDSTGKTIETPLNPVSRSFKVQSDPEPAN